MSMIPQRIRELLSGPILNSISKFWNKGYRGAIIKNQVKKVLGKDNTNWVDYVYFKVRSVFSAAKLMIIGDPLKRMLIKDIPIYQHYDDPTNSGHRFFYRVTTHFYDNKTKAWRWYPITVSFEKQPTLEELKVSALEAIEATSLTQTKEDGSPSLRPDESSFEIYLNYFFRVY